MDQNPNPIPANENHDPFLQADTALDELYRLRREVLSRESRHHMFAQSRQRQAALKELDAAIRLCLSKY
jgi:hypothetical protein